MKIQYQVNRVRHLGRLQPADIRLHRKQAGRLQRFYKAPGYTSNSTGSLIRFSPINSGKIFFAKSFSGWKLKLIMRRS